MESAKMVESLWSLANGITSFAIVQAITFLYALSRKEFADAINNCTAQKIIIWATILVTLVYSYAVWQCWVLACEVQLNDKEVQLNRDVWQQITTGRIICIVIFNLMVFWFARMSFKQTGTKNKKTPRLGL